MMKKHLGYIHCLQITSVYIHLILSTSRVHQCCHYCPFIIDKELLAINKTHNYGIKKTLAAKGLLTLEVGLLCMLLFAWL